MALYLNFVVLQLNHTWAKREADEGVHYSKVHYASDYISVIQLRGIFFICCNYGFVM